MRNRANADHEWTSERSDHPVFPNERTVECRRHGAEDQANHNPRPRIGLLRFLHLVHRNELGHQVVQLPWQRLQDGRQVSDGQLTTDGGECVIRWRGHDVFLSLVFDSRLG